MIVSKKSWHYQFLINGSFALPSLFNRYDISKSLCSYFWQIIFKLLFEIFLISTFVVGLPCFFIGAFMGTAPTNPSFIFWFCVGTIISLTAGLLFTSFIFNLIGELIERKMSNKKEKEPNIVVGYVKAKKEKVCPIIQFED